MSYQDKHSFYHDKANKISGNGVLYSAYALQEGLYCPEEEFIVRMLLHELIIKSGDSIITKRYFDNDKPDSIDNTIGFARFDAIDCKDYERNGWYFRGSKADYAKYSWFQFIKTAFKYRKELLADRNYFRDNNLPEIGKLAYWIPFQYRYYIKRRQGHETSVVDTICFYLHCIFTSFIKDEGKKTSPKNLVVLMLESLGSKVLIKLFNKKKQYSEYFTEDHPLYKALK